MRILLGLFEYYLKIIPCILIAIPIALLVSSNKGKEIIIQKLKTFNTWIELLGITLAGYFVPILFATFIGNLYFNKRVSL